MCVFLVCLFFRSCVWFFFFSLCLNQLSACQWNHVSLKEFKLEDAYSSNQEPTDLLSPQPPSTSSPSSNLSRRLLPPYWAHPPLSSQAHACKLMEYLTTDMHLNVNVHRSCIFVLFYLSLHTGSVSENDLFGWTEIWLWTSGKTHILFFLIEQQIECLICHILMAGGGKCFCCL